MTRKRMLSLWASVAIGSLLSASTFAVGDQVGGDAAHGSVSAQSHHDTGETYAQANTGGESPVTSPGDDGPVPSPFWTKYAYFVPSQFSDLPGWREDNLTEAWKAFRASCNVLSTRSAWSRPCARSAGINARDSDDIRQFIEREFFLYQIRNKDRSTAGVITGYYEPLLQGSRQYGNRYVYPVYAVPDDLMFLDSRSIPRTLPGAAVYARVDGRSVVPACSDQMANPACTGPYTLDLGDAKPDIRDKKMRVRIDGDRIVPYYTRAQIEQGLMALARVIVWVDDAAALYSMQVQGSGKIRLDDGQVVRVAYAEQNGHPFTPPVQAAGRRAPSAGTVALTRGILLPQSDADQVEVDTSAASNASTQVLQRSSPPSTAVERSAKASDGKVADQPMSPEVARMVELLLKGNAEPQPAATVAGTAASASKPTSVKPAPSMAGNVPNNAPRLSSAQPLSIFSSDPSYVFFRQIPDSDGGPLGALGVPLTAGRSVAVDPRTTPLGFPVFISTEGQRPGTQLNRLMLAQDTGGAIRGAVRADYFWGFGPSAAQQASRMKENGRMWLLLPRDLQLTAGTAAMGMRGISGPGASSADAECVVPDPELCVE